MLKKNEETRKWLLRNFFSIAAVVVSIANLWLMSRLAPLTLSISKLDGRVLANESDINFVKEELKYIRGRIDDVYNLIK